MLCPTDLSPAPQGRLVLDDIQFRVTNTVYFLFGFCCGLEGCFVSLVPEAHINTLPLSYTPSPLYFLFLDTKLPRLVYNSSLCLQYDWDDTRLPHQARLTVSL